MEVKIKGVYKHYKGDLYIVEDIATNSETLEKLVIYRALYGDNKLWARPYDLFVGEYDEEKHILRFELQQIESKRESYK
ncbi:MAG: DUF1653 domain-containing protein [Bacilli bacterium]|nr:DUF1653 domain-containing protein [Bacilli bacterium]